MGLRRYAFDRIQEDGKTLPFTRFDLFLSIVLAVALMAAASYTAASPTEWTTFKATAFAGVVLSVSFCAQNRRPVFGGAAGIMALRFAIGLLTGSHLAALVIGATLCAMIAWLFLRSI